MNEAKRIQEWLYRVADDIQELRSDYVNGDITHQQLLDMISQSYETLSVMIKVARGQAYMRGITPPKGL
jgi:hypothetical protein